MKSEESSVPSSQNESSTQGSPRGVITRRAPKGGAPTAGEQPDLGSLLAGGLPEEAEAPAAPGPQKGDQVSGTISRVATDAVFVALEGGLEGVLPRSIGNEISVPTVGDTVEGVLRVQPSPGTPTPLIPVASSAPVATPPAPPAAPVVAAAPAAPAPKAPPAPKAAPPAPKPVFRQNIDEEEDFASLLADHLETQVKLHDGDKVTGTIVSIGDDTVFVNVGAKSEGAIALDEFRNEEGEVSVKVGDDITAYVVDAHGEAGGLVLSLSMGVGSNPLESVQDAYAAGLPVEGTIAGRNKGGFNVKIGNLRAFLPLSQVEIHRVEEEHLDDYIGQTYRFKINRIKGKDVVLSRAALLKEESAEDVERLKSELEKGMVVKGRVRSIKPYGAFIELAPGLDGLLHVSEMSWGRVSDPSEVVSEGQEVTCQVLKYDLETGKLSLGLRQLGEDPWQKAQAELSEGQTITGTVVRLTPFGAFVNIMEGLDGLIHLSNMTWDRRVRKPEDVVSVGQLVEVQILNIDAESRRIGLGMKQLGDDPWDDAAETYAAGTVHEGQVEKVERFGIFVSLSPGVTGLLPMSELDPKNQGQDPTRAFPTGSTIKVAVIELREGERKVTLSQKALDEAGEQANFKQYQQRAKSAPRSSNRGDGGGKGGGKPKGEKKSFGTIGDMFSALKGLK